MLQLILHLIGDYLLQSDWMALNKTKCSKAAAAHAVTYSLPFLILSPSLEAFAVICITHFLTGAIPIPEDKPVFVGLIMLIGYAYIFKFVFALLDTPIFYILTKSLKKYLKIEDNG